MSARCCLRARACYEAGLLTTSELVAPVRAVPLSVADVVPWDTLSALACGLIRSAGSGWAGGPRGLLDGGGRGGRRGEDWRSWAFYVENKSLIKLSKCAERVTSSCYRKYLTSSRYSVLQPAVLLLAGQAEATHHNWSHHSCLCSLVCCHTGIPSGYMSHHHTCAHLACRV